MRIFVLLATLLLGSMPGKAQLVKTLHQAYEVPDSISFLSFQLHEEDKFEVVPWAGNTIMTESKIKIYYASKAVFDFFLEKGRYNFNSQADADTLLLAAQDAKRLAIKSGNTECFEEVAIRIFIPDSFAKVTETVWSRPVEEEEEGSQETARKPLARERADVSEALREAVQPLQPEADSLSGKPAVLPDPRELTKPPKKEGEGQ